jgi:hypothetical protein
LTSACSPAGWRPAHRSWRSADAAWQPPPRREARRCAGVRADDRGRGCPLHPRDCASRGRRPVASIPYHITSPLLRLSRASGLLLTVLPYRPGRGARRRPRLNGLSVFAQNVTAAEIVGRVATVVRAGRRSTPPSCACAGVRARSRSAVEEPFTESCRPVPAAAQTQRSADARAAAALGRRSLLRHRLGARTDALARRVGMPAAPPWPRLAERGQVTPPGTGRLNRGWVAGGATGIACSRPR